MDYFPMSPDQHDFNNFNNLSRLVLKKGGFTSVLDNNEKGFFPLKRAFLSKSQRAIRRLSNQTSNFRIETR